MSTAHTTVIRLPIKRNFTPSQRLENSLDYLNYKWSKEGQHYRIEVPGLGVATYREPSNLVQAGSIISNLDKLKRGVCTKPSSL